MPAVTPPLSRYTSSSTRSLAAEYGAKAAATAALRLMPLCVQAMLVAPGAPTSLVLMPLDSVLPESRCPALDLARSCAEVAEALAAPKMSTTQEFAACVVTLVEVAPELL